MATEIIRQRSRKALVEVSLGKGRVGAGNQKEPPHGPFSIHWARSSSPVLQQLPARLVRVNKPSAKVKETYKEDIMQTVISVDPAEPQIEWHNHLCSFSIWKWITERCSVFLHDWLMNSIWAIYTLRHRRLCEYKNWKGSISDGLCRQSPTKNNRYLLIPLQGNSDFFFFSFRFLKCRELIDCFIVNTLITKTHFEDFSEHEEIRLTFRTWLPGYLLKQRGGQIGRRPPSEIYCPVNVRGLINKF